MDPKAAVEALRLARQWNREGMVSETNLRKIEARYASAASAAPGESFGTSVLYGLGGILLGSAVFAFLFLLDDNGLIEDTEAVAPWLFLGWGALLAAAAFGIDLGLRRPSLGDAFHVAALVAIAAAAFPRAEELPLGLVGMAYALAVVAYRRAHFMVPFLALVAFNVALVPFLFEFFEEPSGEEVALTLWFIAAGLQLGGLVLISRLAQWPWPTLSLASATLLFAGTFLGFYFDVVDSEVQGFEGDVEIYLAALMGAVLAAGLALREKGMVLASAFVIAVDAIVFAFDVGEVVGGLLSLLAVAGLLIWQAGSLRRYLREE